MGVAPSTTDIMAREVRTACIEFGLAEQADGSYTHDFAINKKTALSVEKIHLVLKFSRKTKTLSHKIVWQNSISQNLKTLVKGKTEFFDTTRLTDIHGTVYKYVMAAKELSDVYARL